MCKPSDGVVSTHPQSLSCSSLLDASKSGRKSNATLGQSISRHSKSLFLPTTGPQLMAIPATFAWLKSISISRSDSGLALSSTIRLVLLITGVLSTLVEKTDNPCLRTRNACFLISSKLHLFL